VLVLRGEGKVMSKTEIRLREAAIGSLRARKAGGHVFADVELLEAVNASMQVELEEQRRLNAELEELRRRVAELGAEISGRGVG